MKSPPIVDPEESDLSSSANVIEPVVFCDSGSMSPLIEAISTMPPIAMVQTTANLFQSASESSEIASNFTHTFLMSILASIDSKDEVVATTWLETLLDVIDLLPQEIVQKEILTLTIEKSRSTQVTSRLASCRLLGKIAPKFDLQILKSDIMGVVQSLCQDVKGEVRSSICGQLPAIAQAVGSEVANDFLMPQLVDLCSDDEMGVKLAGMNTIVHMIPLLQEDTRRTILLPLVKKICGNSMEQKDAMLTLAARLFGRICHGLHDDFDEENFQWFINFYNNVAKSGLPGTKKTEPMPDLLPEATTNEYNAICRHHCVYNLPAMIVFTRGAIGYRRHMHETLLSFLNDPCILIRTTLAHCLHQICTSIGTEVGLLKDVFLELLRSPSLDVLSALVPNIPQILACFHHHGVVSSTSVESSLELFSALKQCEESISLCNNWRIHSEVLRQLAALAMCLPPEMLFLEVVPLMLIRMHTVRPIPCRLAASRTLLVYLRHMEGTEDGEHICNTLIAEFCGSRSCHKRMLFLGICEMAMQLVSSTYFKEQFFRPLLSLHGDQVANVRLKLVKQLGAIKSLLFLPHDKQKLQELETTVGNLLLSEIDRDVAGSLAITINQLDQIELETKQPEDTKQENLTDSKTEELLISPDNGNNVFNKITSPRRSGPKVPSYIASQRRKSAVFAPKVPPDKQSIKSENSSSGYERSPEHMASLQWEDLLNVKTTHDKKHYHTTRNDRQKFWLQTMRKPKCNRKVSSADTSPEEINGLNLPNLNTEADTSSPPSPHGMYTWPPQNARHKHHDSRHEKHLTDILNAPMGHKSTSESRNKFSLNDISQSTLTQSHGPKRKLGFSTTRSSDNLASDLKKMNDLYKTISYSDSQKHYQTHENINQTLSFLLSATPSSSGSSESMEDLYAVHKIAPTIARNKPQPIYSPYVTKTFPLHSSIINKPYNSYYNNSTLSYSMGDLSESYLLNEHTLPFSKQLTQPNPSFYTHRLSNLDPSDDEFLIDAGIRMESSGNKQELPERTKSSIPVSKIPVKVRSLDTMDPPKSAFTRVKGKQKLPRPVSGFIQSSLKLAEEASKSLSQENLHSSFTRLGITSNRFTQRSLPGPKIHRAASCNSSPGETRCSSPDVSPMRRTNSASTSPVLSRGSSLLDELRPVYRKAGLKPIGVPDMSESAISRRQGSKLPVATKK